MSDNKRVLLIGDKKSFMVNAIAKGLKDEGFDVLQILPEVNDISSNIDYSTIWVLYLDSNVGDMFEQLTYIKDSIIGQKLYFFLIGNDDEIEVVQETLPKELIKEIFTRPLNVTVLAASLEKAVDDENKQAERKKMSLDERKKYMNDLAQQLWVIHESDKQRIIKSKKLIEFAIACKDKQFEGIGYYHLAAYFNASQICQRL